MEGGLNSTTFWLAIGLVLLVEGFMPFVSPSTWRQTFTQHLEEERRETDLMRSIEREFLRFQAELPLQYVRREDYVRNQTVIEAKLDAVASKIENLQLKTKGI